MEPKDFARILLRRKRSVITAIVIVVLTAFVGSMRQTPTYVAACEVLFGAVLSDPTDPKSEPIESIGDLNSNVHFFKAPIIAAQASKILKGAVPAAEIQSKIDAQLVPNTQFIKIQIADRPARGVPQGIAGQRSGQVCNAVAQAYVNHKVSVAGDFFRRAIDQNRKSLAATLDDYARNQEELGVAQRTGDRSQVLALTIEQNGLLQDINELQEKRRAYKNQLDHGIDGGPSVNSPSGGGVRIGGNNRRTLMLGLIVGLIFGVGLALLREYLDDTVRDKESAQRDLGLPVLANLPASDGPDGFVEGTSGTLEAARTLRATLASLGFPQEKRMLVITSTLAKSRATALASLAAAVAESGRTVLVIGSDLRSARTHDAFGIANTVGLANVIRGQIAFEKAIRPAPGLDGVYVLPCGPMIGNPGELLSSEEMAFTLRKARRWADVVLLDAPPVLAAADASILGAYADGVVLVLASGHTNRAQANEAKEQLVAAGARVLGAVLIGSDETAQAGRNGNGSEFGDLPPMTPFGDWSAYDNAYADPWYGGDDVLTATARTSPRAPAARRAPSKKTAASKKASPARVATQPRRRPDEGIVKPVPRTLNKGVAPRARATATATSKKRATTTATAAQKRATTSTRAR